MILHYQQMVVLVSTQWMVLEEEVVTVEVVVEVGTDEIPVVAHYSVSSFLLKVGKNYFQAHYFQWVSWVSSHTEN